MTQPNTNANVVLTANVQAYQSSMQQAQQATMGVVHTVEKLGGAVSGVFKNVGHKLELFSAGSLASIGAAVTSLSALDHQLGKIRATQSLAGGTSVSKLSDSLRTLSTQVPVSTAQLSGLATTIQGMGVTGADSIAKLTKTFAQLQAVTGESGQGLSQSLIRLTQAMNGGNVDPGKVEQYASAVANLSAKMGASATEITSFAQAIQPLSKILGLGETQLLGISGAFAKAGASGTAAATAFNQIATIVNDDIRTGNPQIRQFADMLGVTVDQFAKMQAANPSKTLASIFDQLGTRGKDSIGILQSLGLDGVRSLNSIQRVIQGGGLQKGIDIAQAGANDPASLGKAAGNSFNDLRSQVTLLGNSLKELVAGPFVLLERSLTKIVEGINMIVSGFVKMADAPGIKQLIQLGGLLAPVISAVLGLGGALLSILPTLALLGLAWRAIFSTAGVAVVTRMGGALRGAAAIGAAAAGGTAARGLATGAALGRAGATGAMALGGRAAIGTMGLIGGAPGLALAGVGAGLLLYSQLAKTEAKAKSRLTAEESGTEGSGTLTGSVNAFRKEIGQSAKSVDELGFAAAQAGDSLTKVAKDISNAAPFSPEEIQAATDARFKTAGYNASVQKTPQEQAAMLAQAVNSEIATEGKLGGAAIQQYRMQLEHIYPENGGQKAQDIYKGMFAATEGFTKTVGVMDMIASQVATLAKTYADRTSSGGLASKGSRTSLEGLIESVTSYSTANYKAAQGAPKQATGGALEAAISGVLKQFEAKPIVPGSSNDPRVNPMAGQNPAAQKAFRELAKNMGIDEKYGAANSSDEFMRNLFQSKDPKVQQLISSAFPGVSGYAQYQWIKQQPGGLAAVGQNQYNLGQAGMVNQATSVSSQQYKEFHLGMLGATEGSPGAVAAGQVLKGTVAAGHEAEATTQGIYGLAEALVKTSHGAAEVESKMSAWSQSLDMTAPAVKGVVEQVRALADAMNDASRQTMDLPQKISSIAGEMQSIDLNQPGAADRYAGLFGDIEGLKSQAAGEAQQYLLAKHSLNIQLTQGAEDYNKQVSRSSQQFNLQQARASENNDLQIARSKEDFRTQELHAQEDFQLSMLQSQQDYQRSIAHATRDFAHQEELYVKSVAESMDPWAQVQSRSATDAQQALANMQQQNQIFKRSGDQLNQLRKMGLNQNVVDVLGLSDPKNSEQLNRFFVDVAQDPKLVDSFNNSIKDRLDWTKGLATNESSTQWQEMELQFRTAADDAEESFRQTSDRATAAFEKNQQRSETEFGKMLGRNAADFQKMTAQSQADFATQMTNMETDYQTSIDRSLAAVNDFAAEAYGSTEQMMQQALDTSTGNLHLYFQRVQDMFNGVTINTSGAPGSSAAPGKSGSASNPVYEAGKLGVNESGTVGTYDAGGKFTQYSGTMSPAMQVGLPHIANPTSLAAINDQTAQMGVSDRTALMKKALAIAGLAPSDANVSMLNTIISRESGWNPSAINNWDSNAKAGHPSQGLMQTIPSTFEGNRDPRLPDVITNPIANIVAGLNYIQRRYGGMSNLAGIKSVAGGGGWIGYAAGSIFNGRQTIDVGERGSEMVLPLNNRGVDFLLATARQLNSDAWAARNSNQYATKVTPTISTTTVDSSTNFTGPVTVQAQDPNAMANALKQKARMQALTRPDMVSGLL